MSKLNLATPDNFSTISENVGDLAFPSFRGENF